ncbi:6327_t:CDS:2 [Racocetra persica]|uniref:6327_t:CDS:1 n=1 Tax=Racocetra persica TaxID=160502 RepID=A0ACA9QAG1_9GLOM|nr:6327_t:CDS:2 [Racocetra persica]
MCRPATHGALRKLFNDNGIIAHIIQVSEGDGGLDLLLSYQGNQICVQSKDRENALILSMVKDFEATMIHFKSSLRILVYNSETMKTEKYLTKQAKLWSDNSTQELIVCNKKQVVEKIKNFFKNEKDSIKELILTNFKADKFSLMEIISENVKVDAIEPLNFYKFVFVTVPIKMSIEWQQKRARLGELVDREYLETLNTYYLEDIDSVYPGNLKFENIINLCDDCSQCHNCDRFYYDFFTTLL